MKNAYLACFLSWLSAFWDRGVTFVKAFYFNQERLDSPFEIFEVSDSYLGAYFF